MDSAFIRLTALFVCLLLACAAFVSGCAIPKDAPKEGEIRTTEAPVSHQDPRVTPDPDAGEAYTYTAAYAELPQSWDPITSEELGEDLIHQHFIGNAALHKDMLDR